MILLLTSDPDTTVDPALAAHGPVEIVRTPRLPRRDRADAADAPLWADRRLAEVTGLLAERDVTAVVCADDRSAAFAWRVAERHPDVPVLNGAATAGRILSLLAERDAVVTTAAVRQLLDADRRPWPALPAYLLDPAARPPLIVSLGDGPDSRTLRMARAAADAGYDSVIVAEAPEQTPEGDYLILGPVVALRVPTDSPAADSPAADSPAAGDPASPESSGSGPWGRLGRRLRSRSDDPVAPGEGAAPPVMAVDPVRRTLAELRPDLLLVRGLPHLGRALAARRMLKKAGHPVRVVVDVNEDDDPTDPRLARADAVTVPSTEAAARFAAVLPLTVLAVPEAAPTGGSPVSDVRRDCGVPAGTALVVLRDPSPGAVAAAVDVLTRLPDAHVALLPDEPIAERPLLRPARRAGVADRFHVLSPLPAEQVVTYLAGADVGLLVPGSEARHEFAAAGVPVVAVEPSPAVAAAVESESLGLVVPAGRPKRITAAVAALLQDPGAGIDPAVREAHLWRDQPADVARLFAALLPARAPETPAHAPETPAHAPETVACDSSGQKRPLERSHVTETVACDRFGNPSSSSGSGSGEQVLIGATNSAGQGTAWARALTAGGVSARSLELRSPENPFGYPADVVLPRQSVKDLARRLQILLREVMPHRTVIIESAQALAGPEPGPVAGRRAAFHEADALVASGHNVGLIFHGSDLRRPDIHARTHPWSPFRLPEFADLTADLTTRTQRTHELLATWAGPVMVSTPDLVQQQPGAVWVPVVIDTAAFRPDPDRRPPNGPPVVLHLPSKSMFKGSHYIDPVLEELAADGVIRYRRATNVPHAQVPELMRDADIFIDQLGMGILGVAALEAMASGVPLITDPGPEALAAYDEDVPLVAVDPETLADAVRALAVDPDRRRRLALAGPDFVRAHHDGRRSAQAIMSAMALSPSASV